MKLHLPLSALLLVSVSSVYADEVRIIAAGGTAPALNMLLLQFRNATHHEPKADYASGGQVRDRLLGAPEYDLAIVPEEVEKGVVDAGKVDPRSRSVFARADLVLASKKGAALIDAASVDALTHLLASGVRVVYPDPKSGASVGVLFDRAVEKSGSRNNFIGVQLVPDIPSVARALESGDAELGVLLTTQVLENPRLQVASALPASLNLYNAYIAYRTSNPPNPAVAEQLVTYLAGDAGAAVIKAKGFSR